ncbi:extracellular solute-binding protein, partial [Rhizobium leguminosarum]|uniref:extracellular solute-binding protein n=1 Tax=Rhizobium leguminosarum TaxID=384 RepID=UPI003F946006
VELAVGANDRLEAFVHLRLRRKTSQIDKLYGVPFGTAMAGGILYNRKIYQDLGLSVPKTWEDFMANNAKVKASGKVAVAQNYRDTWTSQLFVLADYYNLHAAV